MVVHYDIRQDGRQEREKKGARNGKTNTENQKSRVLLKKIFFFRKG